MSEPAFSPEIAYMSGPEALPRRNGELVFDAPWQGRAFALAVALAQKPGVGWDRFRAQLATAIARHPDDSYWECWVHALDRLTIDVIGPASDHRRSPV